MLNLKKGYFIFPLWVWVFGLLGWFGAEIVTASTNITNINFGTPIFSISYYIVQLAIVADIITRKRFSLTGIFLIGLLYGILEEALYIKNPFHFTLLLALGHSAVTVVFPYLLTNFLIPGEKAPFLSKKGYILAILYLLVLYILMAGFIPFVYFDSLFLGLISIVILFFLLKKFSSIGPKLGEEIGLGIKEKFGVISAATLATIISQQNYLGVMVILFWLILRQKKINGRDLRLIIILFLIFHFLASIINKTALPLQMIINYPLSLVVGLVLLILFWRKTQASTFKEF